MNRLRRDGKWQMKKKIKRERERERERETKLVVNFR